MYIYLTNINNYISCKILSNFWLTTNIFHLFYKISNKKALVHERQGQT